MALVRIADAAPLEGHRVRFRLTDGRTIERDLGPLLTGPVFEPVRASEEIFRQLRVDGGTVSWPNGADLCPDVIIWGGAPPEDDRAGVAGSRAGGT